MKILKEKHYGNIKPYNKEILQFNNQHEKTKYLDTLDWDYIYREYTDGLSSLQLAKKYCINSATIRLRFNKLGYTMRNCNDKFYNERKSKLLRRG